MGKSGLRSSLTVNRISFVFVGAVLLTVLGLVLVVVCLVWVKRRRDMRVGMRYFGRKRLSLIETGYEGICTTVPRVWVWLWSELSVDFKIRFLSVPAGRSQEDTVGE